MKTESLLTAMKNKDRLFNLFAKNVCTCNESVAKDIEFDHHIIDVMKVKIIIIVCRHCKNIRAMSGGSLG